MKKLLKWICIIIGLVLLFLILGVNNDEVADSSKPPMITIKKLKYTETNNKLLVSVTLNPGFTIKGYKMSLGYNQNVVKSIHTTFSGLPIIPIDENDPNNYNAGAGTILINSDEKDESINIIDGGIICRIELELKNVTCEEDIPEDILSFNEQVIYYDGETYDNYNYDEYMVIIPMGSSVTSVTLADTVFDYTTDTDGDGTNDSYKYGENINLIGGTATITYDNGKTKIAKLEKDSTDEMYKWFEEKEGIVTNKTINITKGPWTASTVGTQNVHIEYKGMASNEAGVKVIDYIKSINLDPITKYYYGNDFNTEGSIVNIEWASGSTSESQKTLKTLLDNGEAELTGTLQGAAKEVVQQNMSVTFNYKGYTGTQNFQVTITDKIKDITLTKPNKLKYKYGEEELDIDGGAINIEWYSGTDARPLNGIEIAEGSNPIKDSISSQGLRTAIDLDDSVKITGFKSSVCGKNTINLEYHYTDQDGQDRTETGLTYDITIADYIKQIVFAPIVDYFYNNNFDTTNSIVNIKWASKTDAEEKTLQELIENGNATINNFDSTEERIKKSLDGVKQNITVTFNFKESDGIYEDYEITTEPFEVTIKDQIKDITFEEGTIKKEYEDKEPALDLTGGTINVKWLSEEIEERPLNNIEIKTESSPIINNNVISSHLNDSILVTGFDSTTPGIKPITIQYYYAGEANPKEFTYNIKIMPGIRSIDLNKNEITIPYGQVITDEYLTENNINVIITNTDDTTRDPIQVKAEWIGEYIKTKEKIGERQETYVNYKDRQIPLYITIENCLDHIKLTKNFMTVKWGEELNFTDEYKVIPVMANDEEKEGVLFTDNTVQKEGEYNLRKEGTYTVQIVYEGMKADFTIVVTDQILEVRLDDDEKEKIQKEYKYDEELNLNEAKLTIVKTSGLYKEDISSEWANYEKEKLGIQKITIKYKDDETQEVFTLEECFEVEVKDYIVDIILVRPDKTVYLPDEKLDLTGATVRTISASGKLGSEVAVTKDMISGYTEGILGAQRITVKFEGFEKTFDVIFTAQTGVAHSNVYTILITIIATSILTIIAMLTIIKKEEERNKKM